MPYTLVIVESPAKCAKIESFLGSGYKCRASMGHVTELDPSAARVTAVGDSLKLEYPIAKGKAKAVQSLRASAKGARAVILAMDDDREGEAIAWHVANLLGIPIEERQRAVFHEITAPAVRGAMENLRPINMPLVYAQRARQFLDMQVGFRVSPALKRAIDCTEKVSAGRCQTPALRIIGDLHAENERAQMEIVYTPVLTPKLAGLPAMTLDRSIPNTSEALAMLEQSKTWDHKVVKRNDSPHVRQPPKPFTTSSMQQAASSQLRIGPKLAMQLAQKLYEAGRITYMRTDSEVLCADFVLKAREVLVPLYGTDAVGSQEVSSASAGAHEAIRPTDPNDQDWHEGCPKTGSLYRLIWERTMQSVMAPAEFAKAALRCSAPTGHYTASSLLECNPGWTAIGGNTADPVGHKAISSIGTGTIIPYKNIAAKAEGKNVGKHLSEAGLVKKLEDMGIGRPSTYASLVNTIQDRGYVKKGTVQARDVTVTDLMLSSAGIRATERTRKMGGAKGKLLLQSHGSRVLDSIDPTFTELFAYEFTANMEASLDRVAAGEDNWLNICRSIVESLNETAPPRPNGESSRKSEPYALLGKKRIFMRRSRYGPFLVMGKTIIGLTEEEASAMSPVGAVERFRARTRRGKSKG